MVFKDFFCVLSITLFAMTGFASGLTDDQVKDKIIATSIGSYPGRCPCPYNTMRNGRRCGGRSAYSRPGGESPICFREDVTPDMIRQYRSRTSGQ